MQWYYSKNNTQCGPVSNDELRSKLACGEVVGADMVWREGLPDWCPANSLPELAVATTGPPPVPVGQLLEGGAYIPPTAYCPAPGAPIPNYLWQAIVITIFCCWPLGIPAIVYAAKVDGLRARGDFQGAKSASASAKQWCWISFGSGMAIIILVILAQMIPLLVAPHR